MDKEKILNKVLQESKRVDIKYKRDFASYHEFYGVLKEETEELWTEIKKKKPNAIKLQKEAIQCMSVLFRFLNQKKW
jgi:predicted transcriptional regulator